MRRAAWLSCCLLLAGCRDARDLVSLGIELNKEFPEARPGVSLTSGVILTVTVRDSALVWSSCERQVGLSMRFATFARDRFGSFDSLMAVSVAFEPRRSRDSLASRPARLPIRFAPAAVRAGLGAADSTPAVGSCHSFEELNRS